MSLEITPYDFQRFTDFADPENVRAMKDALAKVEKELASEYSIIIGGEKINTGQKMRSTNPANPKEVVGIMQRATTTNADQALAAATNAFGDLVDTDGWRWSKPETRAKLLLKVSEIIKRRRFEMSAWMVCEVGKSWIEADADVAEAIDFCEFYAREAIRYGKGEPAVAEYEGESNKMEYLPLGPVVVIPPWNFPFAITCGMTVAAWVTGNTVVLKPASDSPVIAAKLMEIFEEAGLPDGVVNFITGSGAEIGNRLVEDPRTRMIAFTGSRDVGLQIVEKAAKHRPGQLWIKRVIAEMGGKDAIIVDEEVDMNAVVDGVTAAAFGFQGQKCSACSRVIVHDKVYDEFVSKFVEKTRTLKVGDPRDPESFMGPVVSEKQMESVLNYISIGTKEGELVTGGKRISRDGYFVEPTIIKDVDPKARIAQEEIFGPVCAVIKASSFDDALQIANGTEFGLTGGVFSKNRDHIEKASKLFHVGNLYLNRKCTGALVGVQPFGGFNMSGTDSKAGGRDYLLLFLQGKSITERL